MGRAPVALLVVAFLAPMAAGGAGGRPLRIMPLGDSITQGATEAESYRFWLGRELAAGGYDVDFVGSLSGARSGAASEGFDADHEGHWGWRVDEVLSRLAEWTAAAEPDVVLAHLGTNDLFQGDGVGSTLVELEEVVGVLRESRPGVTILIGQIIPFAGDRGEAGRLGDGIAALAGKLDRPESRTVAVDLADGFDPEVDTGDGAHPNAAGARKMAAAWLAALRQVLPSPAG